MPLSLVSLMGFLSDQQSEESETKKHKSKDGSVKKVVFEIAAFSYFTFSFSFASPPTLSLSPSLPPSLPPFLTQSKARKEQRTKSLILSDGGKELTVQYSSSFDWVLAAASKRNQQAKFA